MSKLLILFLLLFDLYAQTSVVRITPAVTPVNGHCPQWVVTLGIATLGDTGSPCGTGASLPTGTGPVAVHSNVGALGNAHDNALPLTCTDATGSTTTYTCSTSPTFTPAANDIINFCPLAANSGASTLVVNGQAGTPAIQKQQGQAALVANDLRASPACVTMEFNGTNWVMDGQTGNSAVGAVSSVGGLTGAVPGGLVFLEQHTASSSAELDFTGNFTTAVNGSTYDEYQIEILNLIPATTNVSCLLQVSTNGGSTYDTGTNYEWGRLFVSSTIADNGSSRLTGTTGLSIWETDLNSNSTRGVVGSMKMYNPQSTTLSKMFTWNSYGLNNSGNMYAIFWSGVYTPSSSATNAFRIIMSSGNITSGTVRVYGVAKQ